MRARENLEETAQKHGEERDSREPMAIDIEPDQDSERIERMREIIDTTRAKVEKKHKVSGKPTIWGIEEGKKALPH